ncbi:outer membrane beta-barrel protein [Parvularcula lutaonensis]|uniref:Outer membrane beta-barrel protein n=1 Tax=Parvularcula lutaonensis TaxID=491923 RepID=A0ABV7M9F5_9PROT|nr:outer membrane beta-barrel protein [Parvularcula lutaonensis]GGY47141.1 hypothetical protein GCM10007148_15500 [Parvularcula lutaonensis]
MPKKILMIGAAGLAMASASAVAQDSDYYVSVKAGFSQMGQSNNSGDMNQDFVLGLGAGTLTSDAAYRFETDFELGGFASVAVGKSTGYGPFRSELELSYTTNRTADHSNLQALGGNVSGVDAGILFNTNTPLGITTGRLLEDAQGSVNTIGVMVNGYYDFTVANERVHPFVGVGIGAMNVDVRYKPSGADFADDSATVFGYQAMIGADYDLTDSTVLHAGFRYRGAQPVEIETNLLPSDLEVDVNQFIAEIGYAWKF